MAGRWAGIIGCALALAGMFPLVLAAESAERFGAAGVSVSAANSVLLAQSRTARIIVRFAEGVAAADPGFLQALSSQLGVPLAYQRAMSGGAHLYRTEGAVTPDQVQRVLALLRARPDVIYAEEDRVARPA